MGRVKAREFAADAVVIIAGAFVDAVSLNVFLVPNHIAPGGATGLATVMNYLFDLPVGVMIMLINIPLFIAGIRISGRRFLLKTIFATTALSVMVDLIDFVPAYTGDKLISAVFGGLISGIGIAMILSRGATTGGSDLVAHIVRTKNESLSMSAIIMIVNVVVVGMAAIAYRSVDTALYAAISIYISGTAMNALLGGMDHAKIIYVITDDGGEICRQIHEKLDRGATVLTGRGSYTGEGREVLMCVVKRAQVFELKKIVRFIDPGAFMVLSDATEVLGHGFKIEEAKVKG